MDLGGHTASSQARTLVLAPKLASVQGSMRKIRFILEIYPHHVGQLIWTPQSWVSPGPAPAFRPNNTTHHTLSTAASHGPHLCALTWFSSYAGSLTLRVSQADQPGGLQSLQCCQRLLPRKVLTTGCHFLSTARCGGALVTVGASLDQGCRDSTMRL